MLTKDELPVDCNIGLYMIGGQVINDSLLLEVEYLGDGTKIERWLTLNSLFDMISKYIPEDHLDGTLVSEDVWHRLKEDYSNDLPIYRFCDGMISTYSGKEWHPIIIGYDTE